MHDSYPSSHSGILNQLQEGMPDDAAGDFAGLVYLQ